MSFDIDPADERSELDMCIAEIHRQKEQITSLQSRNAKLEKVLHAAKIFYLEGEIKVRDLIDAMKEAEG